MFKTKEISKTSIRIWVCVFLMLQSLKLEASNIQQASTPTGPAGGDLTGTYPNPTLAALTTNGDLLARIGGVNTRLPLGSAGALLFAGSGTPSWSSTSGLVWDAANGRLGIGTASPALPLDVTYSDNAFGRGVKIRNTNSNSQAITGVGLFNSSNANIANFEYYPSNYANGAVANYASFSTLGGVTGLLFQTDISSGSGASDIRFGSGPSTYVTIKGNTGSVGIGPGNTSPTGTLSCFDATATTGSTNCSFRAGAGQSGNVLRVLNNAGTEVAGMNLFGDFTGGSYSTGAAFASLYQSGLRMSSTPFITWTSGSNNLSGFDLGLYRNAAGVLEINNGTAGTFRDLRIRDLITTLATPASASAACTAGTWEGDANFLYFCTATNTWKRVAISTW